LIDLAQEIKRVHDNIGRARRAGLPATLTPEEWLDNVKLFNGLCAYCGEVPFSVLDHLRPMVLLGGTTKENCIPSCLVCNASKGDLFPDLEWDTFSLLEAVEHMRLYLQIKPRSEREKRPRPALPRDAGYRMNINLEDEDQAAIALIRRTYGVTSDTAAIRFALRKILREEGQPHVSGEKGKHRQDRPTR
jgi:hypothetical protein